MSQLSSTTLIYELQKSICDILNQHYQLSSLSIVPENSKDLEYEIGRALKIQGVCGVVITPTIKFIGTDCGTWNAFQCDDLTIQVVENPIVNRAVRTNKTAQDWGFIVSEVLTSPLYGNQGRFSLVKIENGEESGLLVTNVIIKTVCESVLSGMPQPPDYKNVIPFITEDKLSSEILSVKNWVNQQGFIKEHQSLSDYYTKDECDVNFIPNGSLTPSSFTANQWSSINSGITQNAVTKLNSYSTVVISGEYEDSTTFNYKMIIDNND